MNIQEWLNKYNLSLDDEFDLEKMNNAVIAEDEFIFPELTEEQQGWVNRFKRSALKKEDVFTFAHWLIDGYLLVYNIGDSEDSALCKLLGDREWCEAECKVKFVEPEKYIPFRFSEDTVGVIVRAKKQE